MENIIEDLEKIIINSDCKLEGNCFYSHNTLKKNKKYENKQKNLIWCGSKIKDKVCEIGFNAGHSALLMLFNNNKDIDFTIFDIGRHKYTRPTLEYLKNYFKDTNFEYIEGNSIKTIPEWIKNNARWWATEQIGDHAFVSGIQYLIEKNILQTPDLPETSSQNLKGMPVWVKNLAGYWAEGIIDDAEFINGIQYLVKSGIITVS